VTGLDLAELLTAGVLAAGVGLVLARRARENKR
jgi:hypothetical protein